MANSWRCSYISSLILSSSARQKIFSSRRSPVWAPVASARRPVGEVCVSRLCLVGGDGVVFAEYDTPYFSLLHWRVLRCRRRVCEDLYWSFGPSPASTGAVVTRSWFLVHHGRAVADRSRRILPVFTDCGDGRCVWEAIYSASSPSSKSSSAVSTLWTSLLVQTAAIALVPASCCVRNRGKRREDPGTWCDGSRKKA